VETEKRFTNPPASDTTQQESRYAEAELYVVPEPSISMVTIAGIAVSALTLAILTAIVPGWQEGRPGKPRVRRVLRTCTPRDGQATRIESALRWAGGSARAPRSRARALFGDGAGEGDVCWIPRTAPRARSGPVR
jgi:hypothetical protein